ncbi:hypothetical protein [Pedobacter agri]|uniref:hypothetical protein n=1 Tax=Pedobacter agri TaxID=454586 RepID=UPI002930D6E5|nr:hypothetical protein [Pedobacter agri]
MSKNNSSKNEMDSIRNIIHEKDSFNLIKSMGMPPMIEYNSTWNISEYKKKLPEAEKIIKEQNIN